MSIMNKLVHIHFKHKKKYTRDEFEDIIKNIKEPKIPPKPKGIDYEFKNDVFYLNNKTNSNTTIFYIHGGAYVNSFDKYHFKFLKKIIKKTNYFILAPNYKLVPFATAETVINDLAEIYKKYIDNNPDKRIILLGDSAGGGLALSLSLFLNKNGIKAPDKTILLSPCVDISLSNPKIFDYLKNDPWLYLDRLNVCTKYFKGDLDYKDYLVSPTYGDIDVLKNMLIFVGTDEILYPDITLFYDKLKDKESNKLIIGNKMLHVYPILPIKEAKKALKIILEYIK